MYLKMWISVYTCCMKGLQVMFHFKDDTLTVLVQFVNSNVNEFHSQWGRVLWSTPN